MRIIPEDKRKQPNPPEPPKKDEHLGKLEDIVKLNREMLQTLNKLTEDKPKRKWTAIPIRNSSGLISSVNVEEL